MYKLKIPLPDMSICVRLQTVTTSGKTWCKQLPVDDPLVFSADISSHKNVLYAILNCFCFVFHGMYDCHITQLTILDTQKRQGQLSPADR